MQSFDLYPQAWAIYIVLGLILLFLIDLKLKHTNFIVRIAVFYFIGVCAFTPQIVSESTSYAPLFLISLFNAEVEGVTTIYKGLITLGIIWSVLFFSTLGIKHFIQGHKTQATKY